MFTKLKSVFLLSTVLLLSSNYVHAVDSDNDGYSDNDEIANGTLVDDSNSFPLNDADNDLVSDLIDIDDDNDNLIELYTLADLNEVRNNLTGNALYASSLGCSSVCNGFELMNNLDFDSNGDAVIDSKDDYFNGGEGWLPIGIFPSQLFTATFEGNNHTIKNLMINRPNDDYIALISIAYENTIIRNLGLTQVNVVGGANAAGLAGYLYRTTVSNVFVQGSVGANSGAGGVIAKGQDSQISDIYHVGNVNGDVDGDGGGRAGGVMLEGSDSDITRIFNIGSVSGFSMVGGIMATSYHNNMSDFFVAGSVNGTSNVGGVAGLMNQSSFENGYATAQVSGESNVGALIGVDDELGPEPVNSLNSIYYLPTNALKSIGFLADVVDGSIEITLAQLECPQVNNDENCGSLIYSDWDDITPIWSFGTSNESPALVINNKEHRVGDFDNDSILDIHDAYPSVSILGYLDLDDDGAPSVCDAICLTRGMKADLDADGDGMVNDLDADDDNDGVNDEFDAFPFDNSETEDSDNDGIGNNADPTPYYPSGELSLALAEYNVAENDGSVELTVLREKGDFGKINVDYTLQSGTATADTDYSDVTGTLTFEDGEMSKTITINIVDDVMFEGNEALTLSLYNVVGAKLGDIAGATITIVENDAIPAAGIIQFSETEYSVNENAGTVTVTLIREEGSYGEVSVQLATLDGTGTLNVDYMAISETLIFADGETTKSIVVNVIDNVIFAPNKAFSIELLTLLDGVVSGTPLMATITIIEDDESAIRIPTPTHSGGSLDYILFSFLLLIIHFKFRLITQYKLY